MAEIDGLKAHVSQSSIESGMMAIQQLSQYYGVGKPIELITLSRQFRAI